MLANQSDSLAMKAIELLTKVEAAEALRGGVTVSFINQLIARKKLAVVKLGYRTVRIPRAALENYIETHTVAGGSHPRVK